ncbi:Uncharacterised protein [uncultured archaeon]|nr:Uncharacterised protein [uncultured archaeon]
MFVQTYIKYITLKRRINTYFYAMYETLKYALDRLFIFVLVLNGILFIIEYQVQVDGILLGAMRYIDFGIVGGYYAFFGYELLNAKKKLEYCKKHWILMMLLSVPLIPAARIIRFARMERLFNIGTDFLWHVLDELEIL